MSKLIDLVYGMLFQKTVIDIVKSEKHFLNSSTDTKS